MNYPSDIPSVVIFEDSSLIYMARVHGYTGLPIVQADVASITCRICDMEDPATQTSAPGVVVGSTVFDSLQENERWEVDDEGYNFLHVLPSTSFPDPDVTYRVEYTFTLSDTSKILAALEVKTRPWYTS